jgi:hypothetical protein
VISKIICTNRKSRKLTSPSPREPKVTPLPCPAETEGGLPPLAEGGIGEGDCAGDVTRGFLGIEMGAEAAGCATWGVLWEAAGESVMDPN